MLTTLFVVQFALVTALVFSILLQRSSSDGLAGLAGGGHGVISSKSSVSFVSKATFILAFAFMVNSMVMAKLVIYDAQKSGKIIKEITSDNTHTTEETPVVPVAD